MRTLVRTTKGFSLLEMLVYVTILSITAVVVVNTLLVLANSYGTLRVSQRINSSAMAALERMSRDIRSGESVDTLNSTFDVHPGRLTLQAGATTTEFYLDGDVLKVRENGVDVGSLTTKDTTVSSLIFRYVFIGASKAIRVELTLTDSRKEISKTENFYSFVVLRGTYF